MHEANQMPEPAQKRADAFDKPRVFLQPNTWEYLKEYMGGAAETLQKRFVLSSEENAPSADDIALADQVALALKDVFQSSDTDCDYFACVLSGVDLEDDEAFFGGLGIAQDERMKVGGFNNLKLETLYGSLDGEEDTSIFSLLTKLDEDEIEDIEEYLSEDEQEAYNHAATLLDGIGRVVGVQLCADDGVSKIVFTLAKSSTSAWVGVVTARIET